MPRLPELEELDFFQKELARRNVRLEALPRAHLSYLKPRVRRWLKIGIQFPLDEVLNPEEEKMVRFYSGLDEGDRMHSLKDTAAFLGRPPQAERFVAQAIRSCWIRLKRRELVGPEAVETLKLPRFLYMSLVRNQVGRTDQILELSQEEIVGICGSDFGLSVLREAVKAKGMRKNKNA